MSPLPEQKKTPEEIAALRGRLGIPNEPAGPVPMPGQASAKLPEQAAEPPAQRESAATGVPMPPKPGKLAVQAIDPLPEAEVDPISGLPVHRHSADELAALRRRGMIETQNEALRLPVRRAHNMWVVCGYAHVAASIMPIHLQMPILLPLSTAVVALALALFFFFLRPYSKHHGAFISVGVLFVLIYAALQYLPQLQHAT